MRVPEYKEQYRYTTSHGGGRIQGVHGGQNADTQSLLMAGRSMQGLGDSLMKASNQIYKTEDYVAKAKAEKQANELSNAFMAKQTEFEKLKGENALNVSEDFETWRKEQLQLAQQTLGDNERALAYFNMSADNSYASQKRWVDNYQAGQKEVFLDGTFQSSLDTKANEFLHNINNPELMMQAKSDGFGLIQEYVRRKGLGEEVAKQMYRDWISNNFSKGVSLFIDNENLGRARSLLDYGKDYLGADQYASLKKKISNEQERLNAKFEQQLISNTSKALFEQYQTDPSGAIKALTGNKNLTAEQQQKIAVNLSSMLSQQAQANELQRKAEFISFKNETNALMQDTQKTDEEKQQYIQKLPGNSDERAYANAAYSWTKRGYIPTATQDEFVRKYQATPDYAKFSRAELGNIFKDLAVECDAMQIHDPVEREKYMEQKMAKIEVNPGWYTTNDTISGYDYAKKVSADPDYAKKKIVIPEEEREIIKKNIEISDYETEDEIEEKIQNLYKIRHGLA